MIRRTPKRSSSFVPLAAVAPPTRASTSPALAPATGASVVPVSSVSATAKKRSASRRAVSPYAPPPVASRARMASSITRTSATSVPSSIDIRIASYDLWTACRIESAETNTGRSWA